MSDTFQHTHVVFRRISFFGASLGVVEDVAPLLETIQFLEVDQSHSPFGKPPFIDTAELDQFHFVMSRISLNTLKQRFEMRRIAFQDLHKP
jgi:hypothetical protein